MAAGSKRGGDMVLGGRHLVGIFFLLVVVLGLVFTLGYLLGRSQYDTQLRAAANIIAPPPAHAASPAAALRGSPDTQSPAKSKPVDPRDGGVIPADPDRARGAAPDAPTNSDWDFYRSADPAKPRSEQLEKPSSRTARQPDAVIAANKPAPAPNPAPSRSKSPARAVSVSSGKPVAAPLIRPGATVLQVAALVRESDALAMAQALQQKKFPAFVLSPDTDKFYRVQVGPFNDPRAANAARQRLQDQGFKSIIKR